MTRYKTVGIPKGLLYSDYNIFFETFFCCLGLNVVTSPNTNKEILNEGVKCCVDDACMPVKVFHGHVKWLKNKCDFVLMPHFLSLEKGKSLCPMLCGLVEMVKSSIDGLPPLIDAPINSINRQSLKKWSQRSGGSVTRDKKSISRAFEYALKKLSESHNAIYDDGYSQRVALIGHSYIIHDAFMNMNIIEKLHAMDIGIVTAESISSSDIALESSSLYKPPFWCFVGEYYGAAVSLYKQRLIDGIIYLSSFSCGVDSVFIELIRQEIGSFAFMVLKIDEHTGEAAVDTRIEAFADMLKRRDHRGYHLSANGQHRPCSQGVF